VGIRFTKPFGDGDLNHSHKLLDRMDKVGQDSVHHFAKNFLAAETVPDFYTIEIETQNRCNNDCPFCPVNRNNDTRKHAVMKEEIFFTIIDRLRAMDYHGNISLFSNNEPLLDGRILKFVEHAKKKFTQRNTQPLHKRNSLGHGKIFDPGKKFGQTLHRQLQRQFRINSFREKSFG